MPDTQIYLAIAVIAGVNFFTRVFPFVFFRKKELPRIIVYIERYFSPVIMTILIIYSLKDINFAQMPYGFCYEKTALQMDRCSMRGSQIGIAPLRF